jgi:hypothetical protein
VPLENVSQVDLGSWVLLGETPLIKGHVCPNDLNCLQAEQYQKILLQLYNIMSSSASYMSHAVYHVITITLYIHMTTFVFQHNKPLWPLA